MTDDQISMRQLMVLLFTALLSPVVRLLPTRTAEEAGRAGWLSALAALPIVLALCWVISALFRGTETGTGLGEIAQRGLGAPLGKALVLLYLIWGLFLLCANTRLFGLRFLSTSYRNAPLGFFLMAALLLVLWLVRKPLSAFARAAELFYLALALCLGLTLFFGLFQVRASNVLPVWTEDVPGVARAVRPVLSVVGYGVFGAFLGGNVTRRSSDRRRSLKWAAAFCAVLAALQLVCLGNFGPELTARMDTPFFMMVKGIGVPGAFERVESVVIALWVLSDLTLLGLLASACCAMAQSVFGFRKRSTAAWPVVLAALIGAIFFFPDAFALSQWMGQAAEWGGVIFGFLIPAALLPAVLLRRKG